jgi:uncharacterized protein
MSYGQDFSFDAGYERGESLAVERAAFIRRTYAHLAGAILAFIAIQFVFFSIKGFDDAIWATLAGSPYSWLFVLGGFMLVGYIARSWAEADKPVHLQYMGLGLYVAAEALLTFPLLVVAYKFTNDPSIIPTAGILTLAVFAGLTTTVLITKKDFSFLGSILCVCAWVAFATIIAAIIFGFSLGLFFTVAMIALMAGYILYDTSNVLHHYHTGSHVAAALVLFADVAVMFWYILRLLIILSSSRE